MSTPRARSRASSAASSTGWLVSPPAVRKTWSAPAPSVRTASVSTTGPRAVASGGPEGAGERSEADHVDAGGAEDRHQELPDQAEADHAGGLAEPRVGLPVALHGDGADGGEGGVLAADPGGHGHAQVARDPVVLGVEGVLVAGAGDLLAH